MQLDFIFPGVWVEIQDNVLSKDPQKLSLVFTAASLDLAEGLHLRAFTHPLLV